MIQLDTKPGYRSFSNAKNSALQVFLLKARARVSDELRHFMALVQVEINRTYPLMNLETLDHNTMQLTKSLDAAIDRHAYSISLSMAQHWTALKARSFVLAHAGEQQAVMNAKDGKPKQITRDQILSAAHAPTLYGPVPDRVYLAMSRLRRAIMDKVELSRLLGDKLPDASKRIMGVFPKPVQTAKPRKVLQRVREAQDWRREADIEPDAFGLSDFMSKDEWQDVLYEYQRDYIPRWRDSNADIAGIEEPTYTDKLIGLYPWQVEQEMTSDFVASVRSGEHSGAKEQGITDFVWIAVLGAHGKTQEDACEYCMKRDGLTTAEIDSKLKSDWANDPEEMKKSSTPLHMHCYCRLSPATDALPDIPDDGQAEFEEWLAS